MKNLFLLFSLIFSLLLNGQSTYVTSYHQDAGNPNGLNTDTDGITTNWTNILSGPTSPQNNWSSSVNIPFPFEFYGVPVDSFVAAFNGVVTFNTTNLGATPGPDTNLPTPSLPDNSIAACWDEFIPGVFNFDNVYTKVFGVSPNQQLWVKWYTFGGGGSSLAYFALVIEETTNNIYVVDLFSTSPPLRSTVGVQSNSTEAVQYGNGQVLSTSNTNAISDNDYYLFTPAVLPGNDAGIKAFTNPTIPYVSGNQAVNVELENFGSNNIDSVQIYLEINGALQSPVNWIAGPLSPLSSTIVNLGIHNFGTGITNLKAWTKLPNGVNDTNIQNDTSEVSLCSAIQGTYTVGGLGADFSDLTSAVNSLICGISGPILFNVNPGIYNESIVIPEVQGTSSINTITFDGGSSATTSIEWTSVTGSSAVVNLDGTDHVTFKNFTIVNEGNIGRGLFLWHQADHNTVSNCIFQMDTTTSNTEGISILASADINSRFAEGDNCNNLKVEHSNFIGGQLGIHLEGLATTGYFAINNKILNNTFLDQDEIGIYLDNQDSVDIIGNTIRGLKDIYSEGINLSDIMNFRVNENNVTAENHGIYIFYGNFNSPNAKQGEIVNNMTGSENGTALYLQYVQNTKIDHNTAYGRSGINIGIGTSDLELQNNIFGGDTGFAFETLTQNSITTLNYNIYYVPSTNSNFIDFGSVLFPDIPAWNSAFPSFNSNSIEGDPVFVSSMPPFDLHVTGLIANDQASPSSGILFDIDGDPRPIAPSTISDIGADEYTPRAFDVASIEISSPSRNNCGDSIIYINALFYNAGTSGITTMDVEVIATGTVNTNFTYNFTGSILSNQSQNLSLGSISVPNGGTVDLTIISNLTGDNNTLNDTIKESIFFVSPKPPSAANQTICPGNSTTLIPNFEPGVVYGWFDTPGGNLLSVDTFLTPQLTNNTTYYLTAVSSTTDTLTTSFAGGNSCLGGNMFNVTNTSSWEITINSFDLNFNSLGFPTAIFHFIPNGTYIGNETNSGAWTTLTTETANSITPGAPTNVPLSTALTIPAGATYAIYVEYNSNYTNGTSTVTNGSLSLDMGVGLCSSFGGVNQDRMFNGSIYYDRIDLSGTDVCNDSITPVDVTIYEFSVDLGSDSLFCPNTPFVLNAGTSGLVYLWSTGETTESISNVSPGTYWIEVDDPFCGNSSITDTIVISNYPSIQAQISGTDETTIGANDGTITVGPITGGIPPYSILWSNNQTTFSISNLAPNTYTAIITDSVGCELNILYTIMDGAPSFVKDISTLTSMELYPNPSSGETMLSFALIESKDVTVQIINLLGQIIREIQIPNTTGEQIDLQMENHEDGGYFVRLGTEGKFVSKKLILIKR